MNNLGYIRKVARYFKALNFKRTFVEVENTKKSKKLVGSMFDAL